MRKLHLLLALWCMPWLAKAQETTLQDSVSKSRTWFVPDGAVLQFAGNMGLLAVGPSYDLFDEKLSAELLYGYVPKFDGETPNHLLTLKGTYHPFLVSISERYSVTPLRVGLAGSYYFGDRYALSWGDNYPKGYYWWSSAVRILGFAGSSVNYKFGEQQKLLRDASLYAEVGTFDLILTSWVKEDGLSLWDIMNVSAGLRIRFK
ncbi:hypothetical protein [Pontibacter harenae]|uniref:hypothetical protein n=1 Tax=Pontibacter harenae TaxID=2894083 RepID=UPI001E534B5F|nr:hypothetical protein [Pontibacter harenae]MCC9166823.1 hypothetical protein [Pontibacter harenae]